MIGLHDATWILIYPNGPAAYFYNFPNCFILFAYVSFFPHSFRMF